MSIDVTASYLHVAVAVIRDGDGKILIARRHNHLHMGGLWEFPGGKVETGESVLAALQREIHEELDLDISTARPLIRIPHDYPERKVLLDVWLVERYTGVAHGKEGQPIAWVSADELIHYEFPLANRPIVSACRLPVLYAITPEPAAMEREEFLQGVELQLQCGIRLLQIRSKLLSATDFTELALQLVQRCRGRQVLLMLNPPAWPIGVPENCGLHLTSQRLMSCQERPLAAGRWLSASCHSSSQLTQAQQIGVDFAVISPVNATLSHPEATPLGWQGFSQLADQATFPVYALGGMTKHDLAHSWQEGAQGIAAIGSLWPGQR